MPDSFDLSILSCLLNDGRATQAELGEASHLSGPAAGRRLRLLEEKGLIRGYNAKVDFEQFGFGTLVMVLIQLERQSREVLSAFEEAVELCPSILACYLLSDGEDHLIMLRARSDRFRADPSDGTIGTPGCRTNGIAVYIAGSRIPSCTARVTEEFIAVITGTGDSGNLMERMNVLSFIRLPQQDSGLQTA